LLFSSSLTGQQQAATASAQNQYTSSLNQIVHT